MIIKHGISELSKKADSRYTLVIMAAKRARMLGENPPEDPDAEENPVSEAIDEIADGTVQYCRGEEGLDAGETGEADSVFTPSTEPSSDLNLEALRYELEAAERRAKEEKEKTEQENSADDEQSEQ